ncbi:MAG: hypothetical protein DWB56_12685 [Candidatus Jettenia sp.]|nr:MAG: hypothetical protein EDM77_11380 [Candidatus Jettenia sp. AMX1]MBC6929792.1 hypothetical protein [Candidatus Jettenia sp.]MCE7881393.1 hypothetical protein [Candidatus Jettenia sp. AMX1]MCQ3927974.1 hypothetical protein [Candidatus Jettenia sp.]
MQGEALALLPRLNSCTRVATLKSCPTEWKFLNVKSVWVLKGKTPNNFSFYPPLNPLPRGDFYTPLLRGGWGCVPLLGGVRGGFSISLERRKTLRLSNYEFELQRYFM